MEIRPVVPNDAKELLEIYAPYVLETAVSFETAVPTEEEFRRRICETLKFYPYIAAVENGSIIGYAYAGRLYRRAAYDWSAETTVYISRNLRGNGAGSALYKRLEEILAGQNITNLYACITGDNGQSIAFHEKMGYKIAARFAKCGFKLGEWHDVVWMEKFIGSHDSQPSAIVPAKNSEKV